jgi:hypothetical protein
MSARTLHLVFWLIVCLLAAVWYTARDGALRQWTVDLLPKSVTSLFPHLPQLTLPKFMSSFPKAMSATSASAGSGPDAGTDPALVPQEEVWESDLPAEPVIHEPGVRRSLVAPRPDSRRLTGSVKAVSPLRGVLVSLPEEFGGDGVIAAETLVDDFHRRFRIGERIAVAVQGVTMKGSRKRLDLLLAEP